jgi:PAS domain S-box-containing protein
LARAKKTNRAGTKPKDVEPLRDRAEKLLHESSSEIPPQDLAELLHELRIHQIELELQNEELRNAQEKLQESKNLYYDLYDFAPVGYMTISTNGVILESNLAGVEFMGRVRSDFLGKLFQGFVLAEDLPVFNAHRQSVLEKKGKHTCELRLTKRDQAFFCRLESTCTRDPKGDPESIRTVIIDITELKQLQLDQQKANARFAALAENARDIISRRDRNLRCTYINPAIEAHLGIPRTAFIGKTIEEMETGFPGQLKDAFAEVLRLGEEQTFEFKHESPKGMKHFHAILIPEKDAEGLIDSILVISRDISTLKEIQKELENKVLERTADLEQANLKLVNEIRKREKFENALRGSAEKVIREANKRRMVSARLVELLEKDRRETAMALHDHLGQLLTTLKMDLEMIGSGEGEKVQGLIERAKQKSMEALQFSRDAINQLRPVALDTLGLVPALETLVQEIRRSSRDVSFTFFSRPLPAAVGKDKELVLYRIAQEAIMNALRHAAPKHIYVNLIAKGNTILLTIEDDGKGFDYEKTSASPDGGLGIGILKERLALVEGNLKVESHPGKGTQVIAEIPV